MKGQNGWMDILCVSTSVHYLVLDQPVTNQLYI